MGDKYSKSNINKFSGNVFNGPTNIVAGNNKFSEHEEDRAAKHTPEPVWRSPITMAILTWMGFFISLIGVFPLYKTLEPVINLLTNKSIQVDTNNTIYAEIFAVTMLVLVLIFWLRDITKKETRYPLFFNYAISGLGRKITIEKIHIEKCPICGGKMKYFNKPVEGIDMPNSDGKTKPEVTKTVPALQCNRNSDHWYKVDPAEDKLR